jgi:hypothetical protein
VDLVAPFEVTTCGASDAEVHNPGLEAIGQRITNLIEVRR